MLASGQGSTAEVRAGARYKNLEFGVSYSYASLNGNEDFVLFAAPFSTRDFAAAISIDGMKDLDHEPCAALVSELAFSPIKHFSLALVADVRGVVGLQDIVGYLALTPMARATVTF